jgi:ribokinase
VTGLRGDAPMVVIGYVGLDHVVSLRRGLEAGRTALVDRRHTPSPGRLGGCAAHVALGLAGAGVEVELVSWVGADAAGRRLAAELAAAGVGVRGLERSLPRTPVTWLAYRPDGGCYCVYDPGGPLPRGLSAPQRELMRSAGWCVAAVGPPAPALEALDLLPPESPLLWTVKADPQSFPPALAERLAARAAVVVLSREEASFLADQLGPDWRAAALGRGALCVETHGSAGCRYWTGASEAWFSVRPLPAGDPTGAGDRFTAGLLAGLARGRPVTAAVEAGARAAAELLEQRATC